MKFENIYRETEENMRLALLSLWTPGSHPMRKAIEELFDREPLLAEPVFQSMFGWEPSTDNSWQASIDQDVWNRLEKMRREEAERKNKPFRPFVPFKHQAESWKTLNEGKSIVVTSGTGSGKTECFMYPVLNDLYKHGHTNAIEAIFLYPLNALMEDQKKRLSNYCKATDLHFAVYNGDTPWYHANGDILPNEIATRDEIRGLKEEGKCPEILLTNPSMLEYILVRQKDQQMLQKSAGKLRWIVIDEAHSYSGSAAVELGYQIKRIMDAFEVTPDQVRFACTSATIGGEEGTQSLAEYISTITGQSVDKIRVIGGNRLVPSLNETLLRNELDANRLPSVDKVLSLREMINKVSGLSLQQMWEHLCPEKPFDKNQILPALNLLDKLCEMTQDGIPILSLRGHYFMRSIGGLYACANEECSGANPAVPLYGHLTTYKSSVCPKCGKTLLEIVQCKNCGGFILMGCSDSQTHKIVFCEDRTTSEDYFAIDLSPEQEEEDEQTSQGYPDSFFLTPYDKEIFFNPVSRANYETLDIKYFASGSELIVNNEENGKWVEVRADDGHSYCPSCGRLAQGKRLYFKHFRIPIDFINQAISPVLLSECAPKGETWGKYIAFTDSRQATAISAKTFNINVERIQGREKMLQDLANSENQGIQNLNLNGIPEEIIAKIIAQNTQKQPRGLSLQAVNDCIFSGQLFEHIADSNADQNAYKAALMRQIIGRKPIYENNAEHMGLITLVYPALKNIIQLPTSLSDYNDKFYSTITVEEWRNFLKLCLDYIFRVGNHIQPLIEGERSYVRDSNLSTPITAPNDIRAGISHWPILNVDDNETVPRKQNRLILLLCGGLGIFNLQDLQDRRNYVSAIMEDAWRALVDNHIIKKVDANDDNGYNDNRYYQDHRFVGCYFLDLSARDNNNVCRIELAKQVKECPVTKKLIDTTFCGYSPMINGEITEKLFDRYKCSNEVINMPQRPSDNQEVDYWVEINPEIQNLKDLGLWSDRHKYSYKKLHTYIAAEHSAQQSKRRLKKYTEQFAQKYPSINVLHCSTTMEMGVDIGDIDVVLMDTIPPTAANYLQRVGRAGRMGQSKSVAFSLCGNTPVGQHAFANPMWALQTANLMNKVRRSQTIIQRHINSYFFRQFICRDGVGIQANITVDEFMTNTCSQFVDFLDEISTNNTIKNDFHAVFGDDQLFTINLTKKTIAEIKDEYDGIIQELTDAFNKYEDDERRKKAIFNQIRKTKSDNLLKYLSVHQFIPNANMPTDVVAFDFINHEQSDKLHDLFKEVDKLKHKFDEATDNLKKEGFKEDLYRKTKEIEEIKKDTVASRDIHTALNEYAPGQTVVIDEKNYVSAGVSFLGAYNEETQTRAIYHCTHCGHTDYRRNLDEELSCPICGNPYHSIIDPNHSTYTLAYEPVGFCTDKYANETGTREEKTEKNYYEIRPVLLKTDWGTHNDVNMCECVSSGESGNILFYNVGHGHGFAFCKRCGRAAVESFRGISNDSVPYVVRPGHNKLWGGDCDANQGDIARHVVFTGIHSTCYSVLRFKKDPESTEYETDEQLVYSLGVILRRALAKSEGIEEGEIDFGIKQEPNARVLFIYDTAKGGCGYSLKLNNPVLCQEVFDLARLMLEETTCNCHIEDNGDGGACTRCLVDRSNYRYSHLLSKAKALNWLNMQKTKPVTVPPAVQAISPDAKVVYQSLKEIVKQAIKDPEVKNITMCVSDLTDDYVISHWKSIYSEMGKYINNAVSIGKKVSINVEYHPELHTTLPDKIPFINLKDKFSDCEVSLVKDMGNIKTAVIVEYDDNHQRRYFTDSDSALSFSNNWGSACNVYVDSEQFVFEAQKEPTYDFSPNRVVRDGFTKSTMFQVGTYFSQAIARNILKPIDIDMINEIIGKKHVNITFSDKYVNSALASLMLVYLVDEMKYLFKFDIDSIKLQLDSPKRKCNNAQFGDYSKIHFDFPCKEDADEYTYNLFNSVVGVDPIPSEDDAEHHRWLRIENREGGKVEIRFDHSVSGGYESNRKYMDLDSLDGNVGVTRKNEDVLYYVIIDKGSCEK